MTQLEIKEEVEKLNAELENQVSKFSFVFNPTITKAKFKIKMLQAQCSHEFEEGKCKYCGKEQ